MFKKLLDILALLMRAVRKPGLRICRLCLRVSQSLSEPLTAPILLGRRTVEGGDPCPVTAEAHMLQHDMLLIMEQIAFGSGKWTRE